MEINVKVNKKVLVRYAEVVCKIAGEKIDLEKELWNKELVGDSKQGAFCMHMYETFVNPEERIVHFAYGINENFIMDILNIVDHHSDQLKSIVKGFVAIYGGTKGFVQGMTKELAAAAKKYNQASKETRRAA